MKIYLALISGWTEPLGLPRFTKRKAQFENLKRSIASKVMRHIEKICH